MVKISKFHLILVILCLFLALFVDWYNATIKYISKIDQNDINIYENKMLQFLYGNIVESSWVTVNLRHSNIEVHVIRTTNFVDSKPDVVLLHGYGATSALAWRNTINLLSPDYDVIAIDLPGFGRSEAPDYMLTTTTQDVFDMYCELLENVFRQSGLIDPYVVAHSIGGFIFVRCASRNPQLASRLLLANVPGLFSSNGAYDYIWACFFTLGLPHNVLRLLGSWSESKYIVNTVLSMMSIPTHDYIGKYWQLVQINRRMMSDKIVRKFILHRGVYALGVGVGLPYLLNLSIPVSLLYGSHDFIAPVHQAEFIHRISGIHYHVIPDSSHVPYTVNKGLDFYENIRKSHELDRSPIDLWHLNVDEDFHGHKIIHKSDYNAASTNHISALNHTKDASNWGVVLPAGNRILSQCLHNSLPQWAWYPCLPLPPILSELLYEFGIYKSIRSIKEACFWNVTV